MTVTRSLILLIVAIVCFAIGWAAAAGHVLFGTYIEWLFAGLIAAVASRLP